MKIATGVDIEENSRFENKLEDKKFLQRIFTQDELEYCFSKAKPHQGLTVRFCAKEATIKALCAFCGERVSIDLNKIEVVKKDVLPFIEVHDTRYQNIDFSVSLSHCETYSVAHVLCFTKKNL